MILCKTARQIQNDKIPKHFLGHPKQLTDIKEILRFNALPVII